MHAGIYRFQPPADQIHQCRYRDPGVSADPIQAQERFRDAHGLGFPLLSDEAKTMLQAYGVWVKKHLYGRTFMGIVRTTYLIDGKGRVANIWPRVRVAGHAEEVLAAAQSL